MPVTIQTDHQQHHIDVFLVFTSSFCLHTALQPTPISESTCPALNSLDIGYIAYIAVVRYKSLNLSYIPTFGNISIKTAENCQKITLRNIQLKIACDASCS